MLSRIGKHCSLKAIQRNNLFATIEEIGFEVMLYFLCTERDWVYKMMDGVKKCSKCVWQGCMCDGSGVSVGIGLLYLFLCFLSFANCSLGSESFHCREVLD